VQTTAFFFGPIYLCGKPLSHMKTIQLALIYAQLNPICHLLALLGSHHIFHVGRIRVKKTKSPDQ
jgi:hypothetical protein